MVINRIQAQAYWKSVECLQMVSGLDAMLGRCKLSNQKDFKAWLQIRGNLRIMKKHHYKEQTSVRMKSQLSCLPKDTLSAVLP